MAAPDLVNLAALIDDAKCFALVRQRRWPEGVRCPRCGSPETREVSRFGSTACKALWRCRACDEPFDAFKAL